MHAVVAFLAQSGMISGASLVAINTRGSRFGPPAGLIQCAQNSPYQLKRIGRLMVAKVQDAHVQDAPSALAVGNTTK